MVDGVQLCLLVSQHARQGNPLAKRWHKLLQCLEEECEVCLLKLPSLSWQEWQQDCDVLKCLICQGVICPFGCGCFNALNEICLGGMVFLRKGSCWGSPLQSGQIHHSHNTWHQSSGSQNDLCIHKPNIFHHWTSH